MSMSERELEEMRRLANEAYSQPVAARYERTLAKYLLSAIDEICRSQSEASEAAELREELRKTSAVADSLLQERMIAKDLQGKYTAGPGTEGKDILVCERCGRYVTEQVEGILETRSVWEKENAELRERVEQIPKIREGEYQSGWDAAFSNFARENAELRRRVGELQRGLEYYAARETYQPSSLYEDSLQIEEDGGNLANSLLSQANAQANAQAKPENQEEEGVIGAQKVCGWCGRTPGSCQICQSRDKLENQEEK